MNPVLKLDAIFFDSFNNDYDSDWAEEAVFLVEKGTLESLILEINKRGLWDQFFDLARKKRSQWLIDISEFFPEDLGQQAWIMFEMMKLADDEHSRTVFCQSADTWNWNKTNKYLIPEVIQIIRLYRESLASQGDQTMLQTFDDVVSKLGNII